LKKFDTLKKLICRIAEGDSDAFGKFYDIYFHKVYQFTGYFIKSNEVCQEIISDVFLTVWINRDKMQEIQNIEGFLYTITRNKAYNYLQKVAKNPAFTDEMPIEISREGNNDTPEQTILAEELQKVIRSSIDDLPEKCKAVFLLSRDEGLRYQDIAQILSISEKTVNAHIVNALKRLHVAIQEYIS
jgi:RNA polymerase sigma-70 factor (family 1)